MKVKWGVLGAANIAVRKVIPEMQAGAWCQMEAIASRDLEKARRVAAELGLPKAYGSYEELLADPEIEAIYNPLPNHLHVPWTLKAAEAGKHVLCEKPLSLTAEEGRTLLEVRDRTGVKIEEAFMIRAHPQWQGVLETIAAGRIGRVQAVTGCFSFYNVDAANVRNVAAYGGGALLDIGCYCIFASRLIFGAEPLRVSGLAVTDPAFGTDTLSSALLEFPSGHAVFTCSTQAMFFQRVQILGSDGRMEIEIPFGIPNDRAGQVIVETRNQPLETLAFGPARQYGLQGDRFSRSIREGTPQAISLESSLGNMAVIDAVFRSAKSGAWEQPVKSW